MIFGRNGLLTFDGPPTMSPVTTSSPSCKLPAATAVSTPSEIPATTSTGLTNSPDFSQSVRVEFFWAESFSAGGFAVWTSPGGSTRLLLRASGATSASDEGDQRRAAFGTSN